MHQTCTGTKKTKVLNFKVHQTCTGTKKTKKTKTFQSTWKAAGIPLKFLFFFVFFVPVQVWCTLKFKTFVFFVPVQVWCTLKFKTCVFLSCAGLVHFEVQNFCFFVPVQVWCTLKFKTCFFLSLCRFGAAHLWQHFCLICAFVINK